MAQRDSVERFGSDVDTAFFAALRERRAERDRGTPGDRVVIAIAAAPWIVPAIEAARFVRDLF